MSRLGKIVAFAIVLVLAPAAALAASAPSTVPGTWRTIPPAPFAVFPATSVWTAKQLLVYGSKPFTSVDVAEAYDPAARTWRLLAPPPKTDNYCRRSAVWTGTEMLVWGCRQLAFDPQANGWRRLPSAPTGQGIVVWTGREMIGWGGGCCGDAWSGGAAYDPEANSWRKLPRSPLAASQQPMGAWTGHELILFVSGFDPEGKPYPARLARAAAYNPTTNSWRRVAPLPVRGMRVSGTAVWDGREILVTGIGAKAQSALAFNPTTNRWRRLASLPAPRAGATGLWTGKRLTVWGGQNLTASLPGGLRDGLVYERRGDSWSTIPKAPLRAGGSAVAWTGRSLLVWGGEIGGTNPRFPRSGATFTPALP